MQPRLHISMPLVYLQRKIDREKERIGIGKEQMSIIIRSRNNTLYSLAAGHQDFGCPVPTCRYIIREQRFVLDLILAIFRIPSLRAKSAGQAKVGYFKSAKENDLKTNNIVNYFFRFSL